MKIILPLIFAIFGSNFGWTQICIPFPLPPMDGVPVASSPPAGWTVWTPSPDIIAGDGPWPGGGGYVTSNVEGVSVAGGEMAMMLADGPFGVNEGLQKTIVGLTPGVTYSVSLEWQQVTLANEYLTYAEGRLSILVDGAETIFVSVGGVDDVWQVATVTFVAAGFSALFQCSALGTAVPTVGNRYAIVVDDYPCIAPLSIEVDSEEICAGACVELEAEPTGGLGDITYEWSPGIGDTDAEVTVCPFETTTYQVIGTDESGTTDTATVTVTVHPIPDIIAIASDTVICEGDEVVLTGEGADTYSWDFGVIDGEAFIPAELGTTTYTVIGTNAFGCEGVSAVDVTVIEAPTISALASPMEICYGESIVFTGAGADVYSWDGGIIDGESFIPATTGDLEYTVTGVDSETGCSNTAAVIVSVHEIPIVGATASLTEVCFGESITLSGTGADSYSWSDGVIDGVSFMPGEIGVLTYTVTGVNAFGCEATASITITVVDCEPVFAGFDMPNSICINNCFTINDTSIGNIAEWIWDFGGATEPNTSTLQNPTICLNTAGTFAITLSITGETGAVSTTTTDLIVNANPIISASLDTIIDLGGTANLICSTVSEGDFTWTPEVEVDCYDCQVTSTSPSQNQKYSLLFIDTNGCPAQDSVMVFVNYRLSVGVPTAFSPNGDGNNDVLFVKGEGLTAIHFVIYNRYGEQIFETTDQRIGWDGSFLNKDENPGVFTWVLHYTTLHDKKGKLKGNTTLIR